MALSLPQHQTFLSLIQALCPGSTDLFGMFGRASITLSGPTRCLCQARLVLGNLFRLPTWLRLTFSCIRAQISESVDGSSEISKTHSAKKFRSIFSILALSIATTKRPATSISRINQKSRRFLGPIRTIRKWVRTSFCRY